MPLNELPGSRNPETAAEMQEEYILKSSVVWLVDNKAINKAYALELFRAPEKKEITEIMFGLSENLGMLETQAADEGREVNQEERQILIEEAKSKASAYVIRDRLLAKFQKEGKLSDEEAEKYKEMENVSVAAERLIALD